MLHIQYIFCVAFLTCTIPMCLTDTTNAAHKMASTVHQLATRVVLICLREIETAVDVVQETMLGCKVERREPARLSVLLTLFLLSTGLQTRDKGNTTKVFWKIIFADSR